MLIERHNKVILFAENIENFVSSIALMQVVSNTSVISCLGFIVVISLSNEDGAFMLLKVISPYIALLMEIFLFCFAGEYLSHKSKTIADAAYDSLWYNMPLNRSKIIAFIIMRSQTRLTITAGKIISLSLESFASISELMNLVDSISVTLEYSLTVLKLISLRIQHR
nr:PREDICTED: odorant receptor 22c-like [Linepithema humile]